MKSEPPDFLMLPHGFLEALEEVRRIIREEGSPPPTRIVSWKEYQIIKAMQKEGKLSELGLPLNEEEWAEYNERLSKIPDLNLAHNPDQQE